jgi:hypothetical protein
VPNMRHLSLRTSAAAVGALALTACMAVSPSPVDTPAPTPTVTPAATAIATPGESDEATIFPFVEDFTFEPAPEVLPGFEGSVNTSVFESGSLGDAEAVRTVGGDPVTVVAFSLVPEADASEQQLFGMILDGIAAGLEAEAEPGLGGQGFLIQNETTTAVLTIWAEEPFPIFLFGTGSAEAPVEEVLLALLASGPATDR